MLRTRNCANTEWSHCRLVHGLPLLVCSVLLIGAARTSAAEVDYLRDVKPLLTNRCYACHGALKQSGGLRLDTAEALRTGGDSGSPVDATQPDESLLLGVVTGSAGFRMPPEGEGAALNAREIGILRDWIAAGAAGPADESPQADPRDYWSYRPIARPAIPACADESANPIDAFIRVEYQRRGLVPRPPADKYTLLRRVYLDLIGIPPTPQEIERFLADDAPDAYERVVEQLLDSPLYGERWGRHWMDVWRYSDWYGSGEEIRYGQRHSWRWRDWIIESLNEDKGYDRMILEMLAGDELAPGNPDVVRATGFLGRNWYKFDRNVWMFETVEQTCQAFLGLTMRCARCHDHKFDPIAQRDYYRLRAFFEPHDVRVDPIADHLATETDAELGEERTGGLSLVYDKQLDAPSYLFQRGDSRYPLESEPLSPGVPASLGGAAIEIEPIALPTESFFPMLRSEIAAALVERAQSRVRTARSDVARQRQTLVSARQQLEQWQSRQLEQAPPVAPHSAGSVLRDDFDEPRRSIWNVVSGQWEYRDGHLAQTQPGTFFTLLSNVQHPENFALRLRYKTTEAGAIHSVGMFFDCVDLQDAQAVYTATNNVTSTVQAFHRQRGVESYPAAGIKPHPIKIGQTVTLDLAVRGSLLNVWVDGQLALVYPMPMARQSGTLALWTHQATAEFYELYCDPLPADFILSEQLPSSGQASPNSPYDTPSDQQLAASVASAEQATVQYEVALEVAEEELASLLARQAADRARIAGAPLAEAWARQAALAERQLQLRTARRDLLAAQSAHKLAAAHDATNSTEATRTARKEAETQLEAARKDYDTALAQRSNSDASYTPTGTEYPRTSTGRRLALARWIADETNPRTARVAVNHMWLRHFGEALVPTVANFGLNGQSPTHPELLDWLAAELIDRQWRMKPLHRLMVTSHTYRLASSEPAVERESTRSKDPANRYYWRMNPRRAEAEVIRDSVLSVSGQLDLKMGGPEVATADAVTSLRRALYFRTSPNDKNELLGLFDQANPNECYRRKESVVPQQALALGNSALAVGAARRAAAAPASQMDTGHEDDSRFVHAAFLLVLSRPPQAAEEAACLKFLARHAQLVGEPGTPFPAASTTVVPAALDPRQHARENLVHVLLNHNDFVTIR